MLLSGIDLFVRKNVLFIDDINFTIEMYDRIRDLVADIEWDESHGGEAFFQKKELEELREEYPLIDLDETVRHIRALRARAE